MERLLLRGELPFRNSVNEPQKILGFNKYRAVLNYWYGVVLEECLILTVEDEVLEPLGLKLQGIYFYHFHALPPVFEHTRPEEFRSKSWQMENPLDWRGHFLASCFIVHTVKR